MLRIRKIIIFTFISFLIQTKTPYCQQFKNIKTLTGHPGKIEIISYSPDGKYLISSDSKGYIIYWDIITQKLVKKIKAHHEKISSISFNKKGNLMLTATELGEIKIWDWRNYKEINSTHFSSPGRITFCYFNEQDNTIYFDYNDGIYSLPSSFKEKPSLLYKCKTFSTCGTFSPDGKTLVFADNLSIVFYELKTNKVIKKMGYCSSFVNEITFYSNYEFVTWCQNGTINYWNYDTQGQISIKPIKSFKSGDYNNYSRIVYAKNKKYFVTGSYGNTARVWDSKGKKVIADLKGHTDTVKGFAFSPDNNYLITASFDKTIKIWQVEQEKDSLIVKNIAPIETLSKTITSLSKEITTIPEEIENRAIVTKETLTIYTDEFDLYVWDNETVDGDIISINVNGEWVLKKHELKKDQKKIHIKLNKNATENYIIFYAENLGRISPNTSAVKFFDGEKERYFVLESDFKSNGTIKFIFGEKQ